MWLPLALYCAVGALNGRQREIRIGSRWWVNVCAANAYLVNDAIGGRCWTHSKKHSRDERNNYGYHGSFHDCLPPFQGKILAPTNPLSSKRRRVALKSHFPVTKPSTRAMKFSDCRSCRADGGRTQLAPIRLLSPPYTTFVFLPKTAEAAHAPENAAASLALWEDPRRWNLMRPDD
jgi:hypothetical protein